MPTFTAKERGVSAQVGDPGKGPIVADTKFFGLHSADGSAISRQWTYATKGKALKHTLSDIIKPGYFDEAKEHGIKEWDEVDCIVGDDPDTAKKVTLRFIHVKNSREVPVMVAKGEVESFTPVRHAAEPDERAV